MKVLTMQCAYCKETIDDDSFYCNMCGEEIKICPGCHKTGKAKACGSCGTSLVLAKDLTAGVATGPASPNSHSPGVGNAAYEPPPVHTASNDPPAGGTVRLDDGPCESSMVPPELRLINKNLNIDLVIQNNSVLGRTNGNYVSIFGSFDQVSGKHCSFFYEVGKGWFVTDDGSTNGTKLNNAPIPPNAPQPLTNQMFLKISNIEFYVQIK